MINEERLRQTFSEGGAQEIYQDVKASGDFLGFAHGYVKSNAIELYHLSQISADYPRNLRVLATIRNFAS